MNARDADDVKLKEINSYLAVFWFFSILVDFWGNYLWQNRVWPRLLLLYFLSRVLEKFLPEFRWNYFRS